MSPMIVRIGGILVFLPIAAGIAAIAAYLAASTGWEAETDPVVRERNQWSAMQTKDGIFGLVFQLVPATVAAVFWATWSFFRAFDHKATKTPAIAMATVATLFTAIQAIFWIFGDDIAAALFPGMLSFVAILLFIPLLIWFSIAVLLFGRDANSPLWKAVGIVYLAGMILAGAGLVLSEAVGPFIGGPLILIAGATLGGWLCHGIALILGAGRIARARSTEAAARPSGGPGEAN